MEHEIAQILLKIRAVELRSDSPFTFKSGIKSPVYCDNRLLLSHPTERNAIVNGFTAKVQEIGGDSFDVVGGVATSGIPFAAFLAQKLNKPMIYIRKKSKSYGQENRIEGTLEPGKKVLIVEDLISTGGSTLDCVQAVRKQKGIVENCLAIFTYEFEKAREEAQKNNVHFHTLTRFSVLVEEAIKQGYVTAEKKTALLEWAHDPDNWGKKEGFE